MLTWVTRWVRSICWWCWWLAGFCWLLEKNGWLSNWVEFCSLYLWLKRKFLHIEKYPFFRVASKYLQLWIFVLWATVQRGEKKKYWMKMVKHHNAVHTIYGWRAPPDYIAPATKKKISKTALFQGFPMPNWDGWLLLIDQLPLQIHYHIGQYTFWGTREFPKATMTEKWVKMSHCCIGLHWIRFDLIGWDYNDDDSYE